MIASMIFFPEKGFYETPEDYRFPYEDVYVETSDGIKLHGWYVLAPDEKGALLLFHGNAGNISHRLFKVKGWIDRGFSVLLADYRGYGKSEGKIHKGDDILQDSEAFYQWLIGTKQKPATKVVLYGESIGSAPAVWIASQNEVGAIILEAPFTSLYDLAKTHYPFVWQSLLKDFKLSNIDLIGDLKAPLFIIQGVRDEICPLRMGEILFEKAPYPKEMYAVSNATHNDVSIIAGEEYYEKPYRFLIEYIK